MDAASLDKEFLSTFARGLEVIRSFDTDTPSMSLSTLAQKNNLSRASARRFLLTLQKLGYVSQDDKKFRLTAKVLELGYPYLASLNFTETITPFMEQVSYKLEESCSALVLDGANVVYVARIPRRGLIPINLQIGARLPAYATSGGRVLLAALQEPELENLLEKTCFEKLTAYTMGPDELRAELSKIRLDGYAIVDQELELGMRALAVPVLDRSGTAKFALNSSSHVSTVSMDRIIQEYVPIMQEAARKITEVLP
ncbi:MAG: IclR family transcriptional regulator C-terminal domain-containing protein [Marinobacter sp.]|uniref:IclR family transcriptional regulator domain-containing protein n=1 Tax=Marinobacter sp. AC-23 TaxID=1879031 RepID=UPI0008DC96B6|nr:IclR family transcriptional regulator C-terminal domain-containing protein [Marinobacter sp. AC-23]OHY80157.1 IclR family transcriptional regulator [Marinobacter sp. AC-23]